MNPATFQTLMLAATLFAIGIVGFLSRKNMILMFLSVELMLAAVAMNFIAFGAHYQNYQGQLFAVLILTIASCEAAIGLALVVSLFKRKATLDIAAWSDLRETDREANVEVPVEQNEPIESYPVLTPAGTDPLVNPVRVSKDGALDTLKA